MTTDTYFDQGQAQKFLESAREQATTEQAKDSTNQVAWFVKLASEYSERELADAIPTAYRHARAAGHAGVADNLCAAIRVTICTHLTRIHDVALRVGGFESHSIR